MTPRVTSASVGIRKNIPPKSRVQHRSVSSITIGRPHNSDAKVCGVRTDSLANADPQKSVHCQLRKNLRGVAVAVEFSVWFCVWDFFINGSLYTVFQETSKSNEIKIKMQWKCIESAFENWLGAGV